MLEVSDEALKYLADIGADKSKGPAIRVAIMGSGGTNCGLGLILDEVKDTDITFTKGEYTLVIDKNLMDYCKKITIDFTQGQPDRCESRSKRGFLIHADNPVNF
jgi:Fe-S cluster assembly iron-binding protein IscA